MKTIHYKQMMEMKDKEGFRFLGAFDITLEGKLLPPCQDDNGYYMARIDEYLRLKKLYMNEGDYILSLRDKTLYGFVANNWQKIGVLPDSTDETILRDELYDVTEYFYQKISSNKDINLVEEIDDMITILTQMKN